jgi:hypothetical protein
MGTASKKIEPIVTIICGVMNFSLGEVLSIEDGKVGSLRAFGTAINQLFHLLQKFYPLYPLILDAFNQSSITSISQFASVGLMSRGANL